MARKQVNVGPIKDVSGNVNIAAGNINQTFQTIIRRAMTTAEEAAQARKLESRLLAQGVATFAQSLADQASMGTESDNPYKGLLYYGLNESEIFYGRNEARNDLLNAIQEGTLTVLHAESGAGKTSLLQAGIAAHWIARGHLAIRLRTYDADPVDFIKRMFLPELAQAPALAATSLREFLRQICAVLGSKVNLYLLLDQFEEFFHHLKKDQRESFLEGLAACLNDPSLRVRWVLALRADALSDLAELESYGILPFKNMYRLSRLQRADAREVIVEPAGRHGISFESALVDHILDTLTVNGEVMPTELQLVCSALTDDLPEDKTLTLAYCIEHEGGTEGILRDYLKRQVEHLPAGEQALAWRILRLLITADRQRAVKSYEEIIQDIKASGVSKKQVDMILGRLVERRLLHTRAGMLETFELAHEYLVKEIQLDPQEQARKAAQELLEQETRTYLRHGTLLRREDLAVIEPHQTDLHTSAEAETLLRESRNAVQKEQRTRERRRNITLGTLFAVAAAMSLLALWAFRSSQDAKKQANISQAGELAALALVEKDDHFDTALLFGLEGFDRLQNSRTEGALLTLSNLNPGLAQYLSADNSFVLSVAFSSDGKILASGSNEGNVILWDLSDPNASSKLMTLHGHKDAVSSVTFSPDGKRLASGSHDGTIILWDISNPRAASQIAALSEHKGPVLTVAFSPDDQTLASGSTDNTIILWNVSDPNTPSQLATLLDNRDVVNSIAFSPDGKTLASGSNDSLIILWDVGDPEAPSELIKLSASQGVISSIAFNSAGNILASGGEDPAVILWDVSDPGTAAQLRNLSGHTDAVTSLAFSPDGKTLASGSWDTTVILWDVHDPNTASGLASLFGHNSSVSSLAFSPNGERLVSGSYDTVIIFWDVRNPTRTPSQRAAQSRHAGPVYSVTFSPDGKRLASGSKDNATILWDVSDPNVPSQLGTLSGHKDAVSSIAFSPDGRRLASGSRDKTIILWDVSNPKAPLQLSILPGHTEAVTSIAFSPDGKTLASGSQDNTIILWDVSNPKAPYQHKILAAHDSYVSSVAFSPDGKYLASGGWDNTIVLWDVSNPKAPSQLKRFSGKNNWVLNVVFSPDGKTLASGHDDGTVILWDVSDPRVPLQLAPLRGHGRSVTSITFSQDGKRLASGSQDASIILWDISKLHSPARLATLWGHSHFVSSVAFRPDGKTLASGSWDNTIILWNLDPLSWVEKACQRAGRNFTQSEWTQYFPNEEYRTTCSQWPAGE